MCKVTNYIENAYEGKNKMKNKLKAALYIAAKNDVRKYLNGVLITKEYIVATDGHLLIEIEHHIPMVEDDEELILERESLERLIKSLKKKDEIKIKEVLDYEVIFAINDSIEFSIDIIDDHYPRYKEVIPDVDENWEGTTTTRMDSYLFKSLMHANTILCGSVNSQYNDKALDMYVNEDKIIFKSLPDRKYEVTLIGMPMR